MDDAAALILVDLQAGAFGDCGIPPTHDADLLLRNASALLWQARASGVPVIHIQHCAPPGELFEQGAPGWPIVPPLMPEAGEVVVRKRVSNAFEGTDLDQVLRERGTRRIVVTGLQSEHCVAATCRGALRLGYEVRLAEDGHSTWPHGGRAASQIIAAENEALERDGVVLRPTDRLVDWLRSSRNMTTETALGALVGRLAQADPDRPALTCGQDTVSRAALEARTNRLARAYRELGVRQDSFVTIGLPNGIEFFEAVLAVWKLGATPQPISSRLPPAERRAIIDLANPSLVVGVEPSETPGRTTIPAGFEPDASLPSDALPPMIAASFKAPTSGGSTGRPKLIVATQAGTWEAVEGFATTLLRIPSDGVHLVTGPLYHNGPFVTSLFALLKGNHVVVMERFDATAALAMIEQHRVDWMYAVPTMMHRIWRLPEKDRNRFDVSSLRVVYHMAAPCPPWLKQAWIDWLGGECILELYGGTEAQSITFITGDEWLEHRGSVGRTVLGEILVLDAEGNELPPGEVGEIWMRRGPDAPPSYRYVGAEAKSRPGHWESLGDMGWKDEDGYLYLSDRDTDMILVGGANVYPAEVESALDEHPHVKSSCVIGLPDDDYGNMVHAIVQTAERITTTELDEFLRSRLGTYKRPRTYEFVTEPLRGDDGKVRRSALRAERVATRGR